MVDFKKDKAKTPEVVCLLDSVSLPDAIDDLFLLLLLKSLWLVPTGATSSRANNKTPCVSACVYVCACVLSSSKLFFLLVRPKPLHTRICLLE